MQKFGLIVKRDGKWERFKENSINFAELPTFRPFLATITYDARVFIMQFKKVSKKAIDHT
jgi:hypothetical protein